MEQLITDLELVRTQCIECDATIVIQLYNLRDHTIIDRLIAHILLVCDRVINSYRQIAETTANIRSIQFDNLRLSLSIELRDYSIPLSCYKIGPLIHNHKYDSNVIKKSIEMIRNRLFIIVSYYEMVIMMLKTAELSMIDSNIVR